MLFIRAFVATFYAYFEKGVATNEQPLEGLSNII